jgi:signal transduction histidine kinase
VEYPINDNQFLGVWFITDYGLGYDIYWPAIIVPISILMMLSVLFWVISSFLHPIKLIRQHVVNLKKGNLGSSIPVTGSGELAELTRSINKMTKDIDILVSQKQNLLIDVSHELKTPLTRLKFLLANININKADKDSINKEVDYLKDLISNMLLSDKLSTPYVEDLEIEEIKVSDLINDACGMFYEIDKRLKIIKKIPSLTIKVDKYKLSLAIKNLIDNGIKYGGRKRLIELSVIEKKGEINIQVEDFGPGIDQNKLQKVIKPLYRGRSAKEKSRGGFGLGLAITKKIVEAHKGTLIIKSELNKGTKFIVSLPIKNEEC